MILKFLINSSVFKLSRYNCAKHFRVCQHQLHSTLTGFKPPDSKRTLRTPMINISRGKKRLDIDKILEGSPATKSKQSVSRVIVPVPVPASADESNVGSELSGNIRKERLVPILSEFYRRPQTKQAANEEVLDSKQQQIATSQSLVTITVCFLLQISCSIRPS